MQLIADRFVVGDEGGAIDLATGSRVVLIVEPAGRVAEQLQWNQRCDTFHTIRHPALAPLIDFGLAGPDRRFEAWACGPAWRGSPDEARRVVERARGFLRAMSLSLGDEDADRMRTSRRGTGIWVPPPGSGYPADASAAEAPPLMCCRVIPFGDAMR